MSLQEIFSTIIERNGYIARTCTGGCNRCQEFVTQLNTSQPGKETLHSRFWKPVSTDQFNRLRVCIHDKNDPEGIPLSVADGVIYEDDGYRKAEAGFITAPDQQKKGLAKRALIRLIKEFKDQKVETVVFQIRSENLAAQKLVCELGAASEIYDFLSDVDNRDIITYNIQI